MLHSDLLRRARHLALAFATLALIEPAHASHRESHKEALPDQLAIQVVDDRMTLQMTHVPQVYLSGPIDADAPQRFQALVSSGKIPTGSDVYFNANGSDLAAGMALGRIIRQAHLASHLGTPRLLHQSGHGNPATCTDACTLAYLGGVFRWAPYGMDRLGLPQYSAQQMPSDVASYLKDMDIRVDALTVSAGQSQATNWGNPDQMLANGLANNGRLNLMASYAFKNGAPYLELKQTDRYGDHSISFSCKAGGANVITYDTIGVTKARRVLGAAKHSYLEIDQQELLPQDNDGVEVNGDSVMITRSYPLNQFLRIANAQSMGAWVAERSGGFRYGFAFDVSGVHKVVYAFASNCQAFLTGNR